MASPSEIFSEMVTTTLRHTGGQVTDNVSGNNALLRKLKEKKKIKTVGGGYEAQEPLEYGENSTYNRYAGLDTLNTNQSDILTSAKYDWAQVAIHVVASGRELRQNNSKERMINLVKTRKSNAFKTAANNFSIDLYSDGSLANQIGGLANLIQTNGQGTVGGIDAATWTFWRNKFREMSGTNAFTKDTIQGEFNALWMLTKRGDDETDLIVSSHDIYSVFESSLQQNMRYTRAEEGKVGFSKGLIYKNAEVIFDDNTNFTTTAEKAYFLNTDYLYVVQHEDAQWTPDDEKKPINQDGVVIPLYWMGYAACTNRARQGVLIDAA